MTEPCHRIVQVTDLHLLADPQGRVHGYDTDRSAHAVLRAVAAAAPDLVVASGDLAERGEAAAYERLFDRLDAIDAPVVPMAGNHDDAGVLERVAAARGRPVRTRSTCGAWTIHFLDSSVPGRPGGELGASRLARFREALGDGPALVFVHHPPVRVDSPWIDAMNLADGEQLMALLAARRSPTVLAAGHVHQAVAGWQGPVRWLTTPSTCNQVRPFSPVCTEDARDPGFRWFELRDDGCWSTGVERVAL